MLEVGNGGMTRDEYITHFSMWCMLAAPLMSGNDLRNMDKETIEILTNKEVIAINQDKKRRTSPPVYGYGRKKKYGQKPLNDGELAVCFMNRTENSWKLDYDWKKQTIYFADEVNIHRKEYKIRDLWQHKDIGTTERNTRHEIPAHGVLMVRLTPIK